MQVMAVERNMIPTGKYALSHHIRIVNPEDYSGNYMYHLLYQ
jgi:hypothetical protein